MMIHDTSQPVRIVVSLCLGQFFFSLNISQQLLGKSGEASADDPQPYHGRLSSAKELYHTWIVNTSALDEGQESLDYRLSLVPHILEQVRAAIMLLDMQVLRHYAALDRARAKSFHALTARKTTQLRSTTSKSGALDEETEGQRNSHLVAKFDFAESLDYIHGMVEDLYGMSKLFYDATAINTALSISKTPLPEVNVPGLSVLFTRVIEKAFPQLSPQLSSRMSHSMIERYRRISHLRDRGASGCGQRMYSEGKPLLATPTKRKRVREAFCRRYSRISTFFRVKVSQFIAKCLCTRQQTVSASRHDTEVLRPRPPKSCRKGIEFTCELCGMILPGIVGADRVLWSQHVERDLEQYVCLIDGCPNPHFLYPSLSEWLEHMRSAHFIKWVCPLEGPDAPTFNTSEELAEHLEANHRDELPPGTIYGVSKACRRTPKDVFTECPFCGETSMENLPEHIAHHLHYLALKSIPSAVE